MARTQTATAKHLIRIIQQGGDAAEKVVTALGQGRMDLMMQLMKAVEDGKDMADALSLVKGRMADMSKDTLETMYASASKTAEYQARSSKAYLETLTKVATPEERDIIRTLQLDDYHAMELSKILVYEKENWTGLELRNFIKAEKDPKKVLDEIRRLRQLMDATAHSDAAKYVKLAKNDASFELNVKGLIPDTGVLQILLGPKSSAPVNLYDITQKFIAETFAAPMPGAGPSINDLFTGLMAGISNDLSNVVREAYRTGNTTGEISKVIRELVDEKGDSSIRRKADALARTSIAKVANATRLKSFEANSDIVDRVMFVATLDHRTSKVCMLTDGTIWWVKDYGVAMYKPKTMKELKKEKIKAEKDLKDLRKKLLQVEGTPEESDARRAVLSMKRELNNINSGIEYLEKKDLPEEEKPKAKTSKPKGKSIKELYRDYDRQFDKIKKLNKELDQHKKGSFEYDIVDKALRKAEDAGGVIGEQIRKIEDASWKETQAIAETKTKQNAAAKTAALKAIEDENKRIIKGFQEISKIDFTAAEISEIKHLRSRSVRLAEIGEGRAREWLTVVDEKTGTVVLELTGTESSIDIPHYVHSSFKGNSLLHNHPSIGTAIDASLSWSDFDSMYGLEQTKSVAVTNGGTIFEARPTLPSYDRNMFRQEYKALRSDILKAVDYAIEENDFPKEYATDAYGHMLNVILSEKGFIDYRVFSPSERFQKILDEIEKAGIYRDNY